MEKIFDTGMLLKRKDTPKLRSKGPNVAVKLNAVLLTSRTATQILFNNNPRVDVLNLMRLVMDLED